MSRPLYECLEDLENEQQVAAAVCEAWSLVPHKLPRTYNLDYAMTSRSNPRVVKAFVEIKCRMIPSWQYDTLILSMAKVLRGKAITRETGVPSILCVRWNDMIGYVHFTDIESDIAIGGRTDRGDPQDIEPVYHIPINRFRKVKP